MGQLTRDLMLKKDDLQIEKVPLDKGDFVYVREMTGYERDKFESMLVVETKDDKDQVVYERDLKHFRGKLACMTVCDKSGELIFKPEDYETVSRNMRASRLEKIVNVAQKLSKITEEDRKKLVKKSESGKDGEPTSG